jgi:hypothetical protein
VKTATMLVGACLILAGCTNPDGTTNNTETGGVVGGGTGALLGGVLGDVLGHSALSTAAGATIGGLAGYIGGTYIGQQLDQRDREEAAISTNAVLDQPAPTPVAGRTTYVRHPRPHRWASDHTTSKGSATLEQVKVAQNGNECRVVREVAVIHGEELTQNSTYCRNDEGGWKLASA